MREGVMREGVTREGDDERGGMMREEVGDESER